MTCGGKFFELFPGFEVLFLYKKKRCANMELYYKKYMH